MKPRVDPVFAALIPPLRPEERAGLEESILAHGCRDPLVVWNGLLLDGHNRKAICEANGVDYQTAAVDLPDQDAAMVWIIENQRGRRNLTPSQFAMLAADLEPLYAKAAKERQREHGGTAPGKKNTCGKSATSEPRKARDDAAEKMGVSPRLVQDAKKVKVEGTPEQIEAVRSGDARATAIVKEMKAKAKAKAKATVPADLPAATDRYRVYHRDINSSFPEIEPDSVDWIITDPPYPKEYLWTYAVLSRFAERVLKPGGSLVAMVGQSYLPDVVAGLGTELAYHWTASYLTPGAHTQIWGRDVMTGWKPLLWYTKGEYRGDWCYDVLKSNADDKGHHHWGQSESGMADIIERFTYPGQTICDPFCGGGTTGVVAVQMNRLFIGFDIDADAVQTTLSRLAEVADE